MPPCVSEKTLSAAGTMICIGIDPGSVAGLVALAVDEERPGDAERWRWVGSEVLSATSKTHATKVENKLTLYWTAAKIIKAWGAVTCAIERPADMAGSFISERGGQKQRGQRTTTAFAIGETYGMLAAAAAVAGCRVYDFAVSSRAAKPGKPERVGWMKTVRTGGLTHVQRRADTLDEMHILSLALRARPANGVLTADRGEQLDENVLMALGVLRFWLSRQFR